VSIYPERTAASFVSKPHPRRPPLRLGRRNNQIVAPVRKQLAAVFLFLRLAGFAERAENPKGIQGVPKSSSSKRALARTHSAPADDRSRHFSHRLTPMDTDSFSLRPLALAD
jgi:hypothetical protein